MPILNLKHGSQSFTIKRPEKYGGNTVYESYQELEDAFASAELHPGDLKKAAADILNELLDPIRETFSNDPDLVKLTNDAYPSAAPKKIEEISRLDIRVGLVTEAVPHPSADHLYVETIDLGEDSGPRTIVSGLAAHVPLAEMQNRLVLVVTNMKPSNFRGGSSIKLIIVKSCGMVLCATSADKSKVEILDPPTDSTPGDVVSFEGFERNPDPVLNPKLKVYEKAAAFFTIDANGVGLFKGVPFSTEKGVCTAASVVDGTIG